jgi:hypothetical protein
MAYEKRSQAEFLANWGESYALAWSPDEIKCLDTVQQVLLHSCDVNAIKVHRLGGSLLLEFADTETAQKLMGERIRVKRQHILTPTPPARRIACYVFRPVIEAIDFVLVHNLNS